MKVVAGIDVGKKQLVVSVAKGPSRSFDNAPKGIAALLRFIRKEGAAVAVCEATGGYERPLVSHLRRKDVSVCVAPPNKVRSFAHALGYQAKTDAIDAIVLSHYGEVANLSIMPAADPAHEQLKELLTRRKQLVNQKVQEANRLSKSLATGVRKSTERHLKWLDKEIKRLDKEYRKILQKNPHLSHPADLYQSVPGIGETHRRLPGGLPARTGPLRQKATHLPRRPGSLGQGQRLPQRPSLPARRTRPRAPPPLHRRHDRRPAQPGHDPLLPGTPQKGQARHGGSRLRHAQAPPTFEHHRPSPNPLDPTHPPKPPEIP